MPAEVPQAFFGANPRLIVWCAAQLHLLFGSFVLGVPIFSVIMEFIGHRGGDRRYDQISREFASLLSAAYSMTAILGGLLTFALFVLYPKFMGFMSRVFSPTFALYFALILGETLVFYLYYYSWDWLSGPKKSLHIALGALLNILGTAILVLANSWATYMMSPTGIDPATNQFVGTTWQAVANPLWNPVNIHRFIGNITLGGLVCAAYAAVRFLAAASEAERAHYDWMGYVGNFVATAALLLMPFAGYYLGREIYSTSAVMGNNMMGGDFSWAFVMQAMLVGVLFWGSNYYLWSGMGRIPGAERYAPYVKYLNAILIFSFAVWITPHNLPLSPREQILIGGQYHPLLKYLGLMPAKNAVINFVILSTFFSFLLYRRANKGRLAPYALQGRGVQLALWTSLAAALAFLGLYARHLFALDPASLDLTPDRAAYIRFLGAVLILEMLGACLAVWLTSAEKGVMGQLFYLALTAFNSVVVLGIYGFVVMAKANPVLRHVAVTQWLMVFSAILLGVVIDIVTFRGAEGMGAIQWGKMTARSQYALILLCVNAVLTMGLMGFIRSGLRDVYHIYGVMEDSSAWAHTPTLLYMALTLAGIVLVFLALISALFWLQGLGKKPAASPG